MAIKLTTKDFNKLISNNKNNNNNKKEFNTKKRTYYDRLKDAEEKLSMFKPNDKISFNADFTKCLIEIDNVILISNNDSLRIGAKRMSKYKKLWHSRISNLVNKEIVKKWNGDKKTPVVIEFLYETKSGKAMDYDGRIAAFKSPLDGIQESGLIIDDKEDYVPLIIGRQRKSTGDPSLKIVLSIEKNIERFYSETFLNL